MAEPERVPNIRQAYAISLDHAGDRRIAIEERWHKVLEMKKAGESYEKIAYELGFASPEGAHQALLRALRRYGTVAADDFRNLELERLSDLIKVVMPAALSTGPHGEIDTDAINTYLKISERMAKLTGADLQRQEITHKGRPQSQTMVVIGGDGKAYTQALEEFEKRLKDASTPPLPPGEEVIDVEPEPSEPDPEPLSDPEPPQEDPALD